MKSYTCKQVRSQKQKSERIYKFTKEAIILKQIKIFGEPKTYFFIKIMYF